MLLKSVIWLIERSIHHFLFSRSLSKYHSIHEGERCFIIGNGPSLKVEDLERLKGEVTFACNSIFKIFEKTDWRPTYYMVQDHQYAKGVKDELLKVGSKKTFLSMSVLLRNKVFSRGVEYFYVDRSLYPEPPYFSKDFSKVSCEGYTILYSAMQLAYYMGFKEIYLVGVDANYSAVKKISGEIEVKETIGNHFFDSEGKQTIGPLPNLEYSIAAYKEAKSFFDRNEVAIFNATRGGALDVYNRKSLEGIGL